MTLVAESGLADVSVAEMNGADGSVAEIGQGFATVFGERRGYKEPSVFVTAVTSASRSKHDELVRLIVDGGELGPALLELVSHSSSLAEFPLALSLRERVVERVWIETMVKEAQGARMMSEATGIHQQSADEVVASRYQQRLHIWPSAHEHGVEALKDLESAEITTICGEPVWDFRRVHRGAWQEGKIRQDGQYDDIERCPVCAEHASEYPDCQEPSDYPPLPPAQLEQLNAYVRAAAFEALAKRGKVSNVALLSKKLRRAAASAHGRGMRDISAEFIAGSRPAYERLLGAERYFKFERELRRANILTPVEVVVPVAKLRAIIDSEDALSSGYELSLRIGEHILVESGLNDLYMSGKMPRPTWAHN